MKENSLLYIASITKARFGLEVKSSESQLVKLGTFVMAHNKKAVESMTYCWSARKRLGKKFVMGRGYKVIKKQKTTIFAHFSTTTMRLSACAMVSMLY